LPKNKKKVLKIFVKFLFVEGKLGQMEINHEVTAKKHNVYGRVCFFVQLKKPTQNLKDSNKLRCFKVVEKYY